MNRFVQLLINRNTLMISALLLGFIYGDLAYSLKPMLVYVLSFMMALSLQRVPIEVFLNIKRVFRVGIRGIIINYLLFGGLLMIVAIIFFHHLPIVLIGFIFIAISPPGLVIVPFAIKLKGDVEQSVIGVVVGYFASLLIIPFTFLALGLDNETFTMNSLFILLFWSVIAPFILSRFLRFSFAQPYSKHNGKVIDVLFFILIYTVIGVNSSVINEDPFLLIKVTGVLLITLFCGTVLYGLWMKKRGFPIDKIISNQLMFGVKNNGFSAILALSIGNNIGGLPSVILSVVLLVFLIIYPTLIPKINH